MSSATIRPNEPFSGTAAVTALIAGAAGSVGLTFYAGLRVGSPPILLVLFSGWVLAPFAVFAVAYLLAGRWTVLSRQVFCASLPVASVAALMIYGAAAFGAARPRTAVFVVVAPLSVLLVGTAVAMAALVSRRRR
jgi:hypothetical protein